MKRLVLIIACFACYIYANSREVISFNDGWAFKFFDTRTLSAGSSLLEGRGGTPVTIPHTWNADDYLAGNGQFKRNLGIYTRSFDVPADYKGKRLFLRFEGAMSVANVFVNGSFAGEHLGGYNAFTFEITDLVRFDTGNQVLVGVDNSPRYDVAPIGGDFNLYGGLYRDVWLIVTDDVCISPLKYGSSGVFISQSNVSHESADLNVEILISSVTDYSGVEIEFKVFDADKNLVASSSTDQVNNDKAVLKMTINSPHLWNGRSDPYLYTTVTSVKRGDKEIDSFMEPFGFRYFSIDPDKGLFLNGEHLKLRGVSRHQDFEGAASAMTREMHVKDFDLFEEMGVNALRLAHYPQAHFMFYEADRRGFIVWEEIPFVGGYINSGAFDNNLRYQLNEMILQNYNHPSIFFWGLFNEIAGDFDDILASLNDIAHCLDRDRMTVVAAHQDGSFNHITDATCWNKYYGWYYASYDEFTGFFDTWHEKYPDARIGVSEYGAGASISHHIDPSILDTLPFSYYANDKNHKSPLGKWHPEEWQTQFHMEHLKMITERDYLWGSYIWNMFDFGSNVRNEGDRPGINDKGLVTHDRQTRKDAFYLYKANWNKDEPVLHLCGKRYTEPRESPAADIIVFTNQPDVQLFINGVKTGKKVKPDEYATVTWKAVRLNKGDNVIEVKSKELTDSCIWKVE